ncbi:MAG: 6-carboxyhexanoate--CoA ligase [Nitrospirae bacterium]|nr:6-carboxyhexanoate--CoA ligase [Nitrospirota bacterium]
MRASEGEKHISGAEGLYPEDELQETVAAYLQRALQHDRGEPDRVVLTVERLEEEPQLIEMQPVYTVSTGNYSEAWRFVKEGLICLGVSGETFNLARSIIESPDVMRGAAIVRAVSGVRAEPDMLRGVRATRLGIMPGLLPVLYEALGRFDADRAVVSEAVVLASKVASSPYIVAELCVSDDPFYTTGYLSSKNTGYVRVPHIKEKGMMNGGRVFFVTEECVAGDVVRYLEETPVMVNKLSDIHDIINPDEFICSINR